MNTPRSTKAEQSAPNKRQFTGIGGFPARKNTVTADVLARLLNGERLTSLDTVYEASTTRLGAFTFRLRDDYGWQIETLPTACGCNDGRVSWVHEYFLPAEVITCALAAGAAEWCAEVRAERRKRRAHAAQAKREAIRANAARHARRPHPGQCGLFEGNAA